METSAKMICHSISSLGKEIATMELCYPRFIHAEAKTHRILSLDDEEYELVLKQDVDLMDDAFLSRNASSSRAIPIEKMIKQVQQTPAMPIHWGKNQPGMQARKEHQYPELGQLEWEGCKEKSIYYATELNKMGFHKQIVNRLLEPFQWISVVVTSTEWDNFFKLRLHPDAQPEIKELARCMREAMDASIPDELNPGEYHLPYVNWDEFPMSMFSNKEDLLQTKIKCSIARCARVSYLNHDASVPDVSKDIALADKLLEAGHLSPFEHIATPMEFIKEGYVTDGITRVWLEIGDWEQGITHMDRDGTLWSGNFRGWIQHRQIVSAV